MCNVIPGEHSSKYFVMLYNVSCCLDKDYDLPEAMQCWRMEYEPLLYFFKYDTKKAQDAFFKNYIYAIFTGLEIKSRIQNYQINRDRIYMHKTKDDKELFWQIIDSRKEEFLSKCKAFKKMSRKKRKQILEEEFLNDFNMAGY